MIDEIQRLETLSWRNEKFSLWLEEVFGLLENEFGRDSDYYQLFNDINCGPELVTGSRGQKEQDELVMQKRYLEKLDSYRTILKVISEDVSEVKQS